MLEDATVGFDLCGRRAQNQGLGKLRGEHVYVRFRDHGVIFAGNLDADELVPPQWTKEFARRKVPQGSSGTVVTLSSCRSLISATRAQRGFASIYAFRGMHRLLRRANLEDNDELADARAEGSGGTMVTAPLEAVAGL